MVQIAKFRNIKKRKSKPKCKSLNAALENNHRCFWDTYSRERSKITEGLRVSVTETRGRIDKEERFHVSSPACLSYPPLSARASQRQTGSTAVELKTSGAARRRRCMCFSSKGTSPFSEKRSRNTFPLIPVTPTENTSKCLCKD